VYNGPLRIGTFGSFTEKKLGVFECAECNVGFLSHTPKQASNFYEDGSYRESYNISALISDYRIEHDPISIERLEYIDITKFRGMTVADFGCGGGSFLDIVSGFAKKTIAIEPTKNFHKDLKTKYQVFSYGSELIDSNITVDIATTFDVIEHVNDPIKFIKEIRDSLSKGGRLILTTPNHDDILREMNLESFSKFNYRTAHLFYFTGESIKYVLEKAGFSKINIKFMHRFDLSNLLMWLKDGEPTGLGSYSLFNNEINYSYKKILEETGRASDILVEAIK
jgi:2-polyprenyl-3-methyl-5-hydroxy-6-metoxy-1,4-benzoquinol methylase